MMRSASYALVIALFISACGLSGLRRRAATEFECPEDSVTLDDIGGGAVRAEGCGKSAIYVCARDSGGIRQCARDSQITGGESAAPSTPAVTAHGCNPPCSPGYDCENGECMPLCNPPCGEGMQCGQDRVCTPVVLQDAVNEDSGPAGSQEQPSAPAVP